MKTLLRASMLGLLMFALVAVSAPVIYAQEKTKTQVYEDYTNNYAAETVEELQIALTAAEEFLRRFNAPEDKEIRDYLQNDIPRLKDAIATLKKQAAEAEIARKRQERFGRWDKAFTAKNWDQFYSIGDEILKDQPEYFDVAIVLAGKGYYLAFDNNNKYVDRSLMYAKTAISALEAGKESKTKLYGGYDSIYKTKEYSNGRDNALGWLNFQIGWLNYYRKENKETGIKHFFKATQYNSGAKKFPTTYRAIGFWYVSKTQDLIKQRDDLLAQRNAEVDKEEPDSAKIKQLDFQIDSVIAMEKGYAERAIDAFSRAYNAVEAKDKTGDFAKGLFSTLQQLYKVRYEEEAQQTDANINTNLALIASRSMPDPTSTVAPINPPKPPATEGDKEENKAGASRDRTVSGTTANNNF